MTILGIHICPDEINACVNCLIPMWEQTVIVLKVAIINLQRKLA